MSALLRGQMDTTDMNLPSPTPKSSDPARLAADIVDRLTYRIGKDATVATPDDWLTAAVLVVRDRVVERWMESTRETYRREGKRVYYLSMEFLIGRLMRDAVTNLELVGEMQEALGELGVELDLIRELEPDAALGNGGLGRLAACFMESMASVDIPAYGYGIRYQNGMFRQELSDGWQVELPETWLEHGNPWEFERRESRYEIGFGGHIERDDADNCTWKPAERFWAEAFDTPIVGWKAKRVNTLRLWRAEPIDPLELEAFNRGDHMGALQDSMKAEALSRVLYPADATPAGQALRLRQEFFFSSASLQDILRRHMAQFGRITSLPEKAAIQLNDTHPAVSVAELMRLLIDVHNLDFDTAWDITKRTIAYTNHTLLPEALESWPVPLFEQLLPRHMQLIYKINARVLREARATGTFDDAQVAGMSLIDEHGERRVRMGNLAFVGAHSINGVSGLHTELMKETVFKDLHKLYPLRINNKTNGITPRRWLMQCNPGLYNLSREVTGDSIMSDLDAMKALDTVAEDAAFQERFAAIKRANKDRLAGVIEKRIGLKVDPSAMFDIQIKRIHEYKRQLMNIVETVALYDQIRSHPERAWAPRVKLFAGKAASSYHNAKLIIKLANDVARVVNADPATRDVLKVAFLPNYNVSLAEVMVPAADLSEQISTAGMEASGTGNMKFALNGALTIGTLDGANVEMREHIGAENIIIFGLTAAEVAEKRANGYSPEEVIAASPELSQALKAIESGVFSPEDRNRYADLVAGLRMSDWFMVAADFDSYAAAQRDVDGIWAEQPRWQAMAIRNAARMGYFSSDRTIRQYGREIWNVIN
ncbi:glycogen/starch/alpha-glucan phosphorylase [Pontivivens insulae]|uniref:Alpha-1,4 glucan phosphorylase n=1 Tax=Pontivivens insulae TaxID=1639689 RepID=A0A2R8AD28_9RHOB|nr:glycogen/starch/alpha-glucan phosphorylase [Pontivivens insulae]RED14080.1 glycogen phosphorylase [Pontivivens insulae]SPF30154.1 Maltodextrin phosphorylase [Pontivivens insulae]